MLRLTDFFTFTAATTRQMERCGGKFTGRSDAHPRGSGVRIGQRFVAWYEQLPDRSLRKALFWVDDSYLQGY